MKQMEEWRQRRPSPCLRPLNYVWEPRVWLRSARPTAWCIKFISLDSWHVLGCVWKPQKLCVQVAKFKMWHWVPGLQASYVTGNMPAMSPVKRIGHPLLRAVSKWQWSLQKRNASSVFEADEMGLKTQLSGVLIQHAWKPGFKPLSTEQKQVWWHTPIIPALWKQKDQKSKVIPVT